MPYGRDDASSVPARGVRALRPLARPLADAAVATIGRTVYLLGGISRIAPPIIITAGGSSRTN